MINFSGGTKAIVSADDFGISELSNNNILALLKAGKLDRVAVMIDGARFPTDQEKEALLASGAAIDVHLNAIQKITADRKLSEPIFSRLANFIFRFVSGSTRTEKMEKKWRYEIETFRKIFGKNPDGISAHQHIHFFPDYFQAIVKLAKEFQIAYIRFGKKGVVKRENNISRIIRFLHRKDRKMFEDSGLNSTDFWASLDWFESAEELRKNLPAGEIELVCHPEREKEFVMIKNHF